MALSVDADETALDLFRRANRKPLRTGLAFLDEVVQGVSALSAWWGRLLGGLQVACSHQIYESLLSNNKVSDGTPGAEKGVGLGDVVEVYGASGSGKSEVLINVVAQHILPAWLGGEEQTAVYFDNDGRLSILRLEQLLKEKIMNNTTFQVKRAAENGASIGGGSSEKHGAASTLQQRQPHLDDDVERLLASCLSRLSVVRPGNLFELLASLEILRFELGHRPAVVAVDGMGTYYWQDKMAHSCGGDAVSMQGAVARALVRLATERPLIILAAKLALFASRAGSEEAVEHREYLPRVWQRAVTHRVTVKRRQRRPPTEVHESSRGGFSLFTARVLSFKGSTAASRGSGRRGWSRGAGASAGSTGDEPATYFFVVTDDGIHHVPAAAAAATAGVGDERNKPCIHHHGELR